MNYGKIYNDVIISRKNNPLNKNVEYSEVHHIIPASLGGKDIDDNMIRLSAREHFICHLLLSKMFKYHSFKWYKMNHAFMFMKSNPNKQSQRYINARLYEHRRKYFSDVMSLAQQGEKNSQYGKKWISNIDELVNKRVYEHELDDFLTNGWIIGRNAWNKTTHIPKYKWRTLEDRIKIKNVQIIKELERIESRKQRQEEFRKQREEKHHNRQKKRFKLASRLWENYTNGNYSSIRDFVRLSDYDKSHVALTRLWKQYIPQYSDIVVPCKKKQI